MERIPKRIPPADRALLRRKLALSADLKSAVWKHAPDPRQILKRILDHRVARAVPSVGSWRYHEKCTWQEAVETWPGNGLFSYKNPTPMDNFATRVREARSFSFRVLECLGLKGLGFI
jgi:hypothetical protein